MTTKEKLEKRIQGWQPKSFVVSSEQDLGHVEFPDDFGKPVHVGLWKENGWFSNFLGLSIISVHRRQVLQKQGEESFKQFSHKMETQTSARNTYLDMRLKQYTHELKNKFDLAKNECDAQRQEKLFEFTIRMVDQLNKQLSRLEHLDTLEALKDKLIEKTLDEYLSLIGQ